MAGEKTTLWRSTSSFFVLFRAVAVEKKLDQCHLQSTPGAPNSATGDPFHLWRQLTTLVVLSVKKTLKNSSEPGTA